MTARGLWQRRWLSLVVLVVATMAATAAAMGPTYAEAARTEIVRDAFTEAPADAQGLLVLYEPSQVIMSGPRLPPPTEPEVTREATGIPHAFRPALRGASLASGVVEQIGDVRITWRPGACDHLRLVSGRCPTAPGEAIASSATSVRYGWTLGASALLEELIPPSTAGADGPAYPYALEIVGIYEPLDPHDLYWFGRQYFPDTTGTAVGPREGPEYDPLFIDEATLEWAAEAEPQWVYEDTLLLDPTGLESEDARPLARARYQVEQWLDGRATVVTSITRTANQAVADQGSFGVPVTLVSLELVALCWLLLFLSVGDLVQARGRDIGLARLRGLARWRIWLFGLAEPLVLLAGGLVAGILLTWPLANAMSQALLSTEPRVAPGPLALAAALGAILGGLIASAVAARSTLTLPVTQNWRRSRSRPVARSWVPDAVVLALVVAGVVELSTSGVVTNPSQERSTVLLVPALLGLGSALAAARAVPALCRRAFPATRRRGGLALFLALRHLGRSPGTANTVIVLATSFTLATFAVSAWSVTMHNHREVARVHNGADTVFVVLPPSEGPTLPELVERVDPDGHAAMAVRVDEGSVRIIAADSRRVADVAYWQPEFTDEPLTDLLPQLRPSLPPPVIVGGDAVRITIEANEYADPVQELTIDVEIPGRAKPLKLPLDPLPANPDVLERPLPPGCADGCELRSINVTAGLAGGTFLDEAAVVIRQIETRAADVWSPVEAGLTDTDGWRNDSSDDNPTSAVASPDGLKLVFIEGSSARAIPASIPDVVPAIVVGQVAPEPNGNKPTGLDGASLPLRWVDHARAVPGATGPAILVDYDVASQHATGLSGTVEHQVWVAPGEAARIRTALEREGVDVTATRTTQRLNRRFNGQGPGLALVLLVTAAGAAAVLAMARAAFGVYAAGRRRSYELAALGAVGVPLRTRRTALLAESAVTLGVGVTTGVVAGIVASRIALGRVPQFTVAPSTPPLVTTPDPLVAVGVAAAAAAAVALAVVLTTTAAIRRPSGVDQLREAP